MMLQITFEKGPNSMQSSLPAKFNASHAEESFLDALRQTMSGRILVALSATAFVAVCAHISLPLPYTPVPLTLSDFAVLLVGMVLGPAAGFSAMVLYLTEGALGLPVFNPQGLGGVVQLMGPTAGYLFAYPFAAAVAGLANGMKHSNMTGFTKAIIAGTGATVIILGCGAGWLGHSRFLTKYATWTISVAPFLFGALAKIVAAAGIFTSTRRWFRA
jgi:biotin transport system substrate-specific component